MDWYIKELLQEVYFASVAEADMSAAGEDRMFLEFLTRLAEANLLVVPTRASAPRAQPQTSGQTYPVEPSASENSHLP